LNATDLVSLLASPGSVPSAVETARDIGVMVRVHLLTAMGIRSLRAQSRGLEDCAPAIPGSAIAAQRPEPCRPEAVPLPVRDQLDPREIPHMNMRQQMNAEGSPLIRRFVAKTPYETRLRNAAGVGTAGRNARILIIDDDVSVTPGLRRLLQDAGLHVDVMTSLRFPLAPGMFDDYHAVIVDVMVPQTNGFDGLRSICSVARLPVIVLTARGDEEDRITGLAMGADDYVVKPCRPREVVARVRALLRRRATRTLTDAADTDPTSRTSEGQDPGRNSAA